MPPEPGGFAGRIGGRGGRTCRVAATQNCCWNTPGNGTQPAFEEIVRRYQWKIYSYLRQYLGDEQLAEDALQATFLQVHLKCRLFDPSRRLSPWLFRIATNQANDLLRRNRRHKAVSLDVALGGGRDTPRANRWRWALRRTRQPRPRLRLEATEDRQRVWSAMERLPQPAKQLLILVKCQDLSYQEVARLLGIPLGTVKSRMNEALRKLHRALLAADHDSSGRTQASSG